MKDPTTQDSYVLKLSGKAEIGKPLEIGHNIKTVIEGSIVSETIADNEDGSHTHYFNLKPVIVETIDEKGERLRAKDIRSRSQQLRAMLMRKWRELNEPKEFDEWYDERMVEIISSIY